MNHAIDFKPYQLEVIGPWSHSTLGAFAGESLDSIEAYENRIHAIQRFRGRVYVEDQAIPADTLDPTGRHVSAMDYDCWHLLLTDIAGGIHGSLRIRRYGREANLEDLNIRHTLGRLAPEQAEVYRDAIERFIGETRAVGATVTEAGGWAVSQEARRSSACIGLVLAVWSLNRLLGHGRSLAPTTVKHHTVRIHHRLGGFALTDARGQRLSGYYDRVHRCDMEIVAFDSTILAPRHEAAVLAIQEHFRRVGVVELPEPAVC